MISKIDCRLFIEGCQIPFNSINISAEINQPSICTIEVAPSEFVRQLLPRSHILVVFLEERTWRVLWDGELRGWGMSKSSGSISMQITAMDYTNAFGFMTKNIIDNMSATASTYAIFHTGAEFQFSAPGGGTFVNEVRRALESSGGFSLNNIILEIIKSTYNNIPYFSYYNKKNKLLDRLLSLEDTSVHLLLENSVAYDYMKNVVQNRFIGNVSLDRIMNYMLDIAGYWRVPIVAPSPYKGTAPTCLMKPFGYFTTPPVCNAFFPDMYHTISGLGVDYLTEPTRILLHAQEADMSEASGGYTPIWFFNETGPQNQSFRDNKELMSSFLSQDEVNKGVLPYEKSLNFEKCMNVKNAAQYATEPSEFEGNASMVRSMQGYAYYEYVKAKFAHRTAQISCIFHPFAVVGFPGAIFDKHQSLFGMVSGIQHTISADGLAATTVSFSHVYPADRSDINHLYSPPLPRWISPKYRPRGCEETYNELFGRNSYGHAAIGGHNVKKNKFTQVNVTNDPKYIYDNDQENIADIVSNVFLIPKKAGAGVDTNKEEAPLYEGNPNAQFAYDYTRREVISLGNYLKAMGIGEFDDNNLMELPTIISQNANLYLHPTDFAYTGTEYIPRGAEIARRQNIAQQLQADLLNVTGKLGK